MDVVLLTLTIFSLAAAAGFAAVTWYTLRDARERSQARVASLAQAIDGEDRVPVIGLRSSVNGIRSGTAGHAGADVSPAADRRPQTGDHSAALFDAAARSTTSGRPLLKLAVGFGMAVLVIVAIAMTAVGHDTPAASSAATGQPSAAPALELLSMRHEEAAEGLTVTGLVRNPGGAPARAIVAVVFAFDRDGNFLASGRAPLEYDRLDGGDESPFRVTIANVNDVGRYRVSFRTDACVVRHVDRRSARGQLAAVEHQR